MIIHWIKKAGAGIIFLILLGGPVHAADSTMPLTMEGGTARAMSMGSAAVGLPQGSSSLFWNPAGLAAMGECKELALHHNSGLGDSISETLVYGTRIGDLGGFAFSFNYVTNGTFQGRDSFGVQTADYNPYDLGSAVGWGTKLAGNLSGGLAAKFNYQSLSGNSYAAVAMDFGLMWNPMHRLNLGLTYSNLGTAVAGSTLDSGFRIGASYGLNDSVLLAASSEVKLGGFDRLQVGAEDYFVPGLAIRAGYVLNFTDTSLDGLTGLTAGLGIALLKDLTFDYAIIPYGDLGTSHRLSLTWNFGCPEKKAALPPKKEAVASKPEPRISGINPKLGPSAGGTTVVISGIGFTGMTEPNGVMFGRENAASYTVFSDSQIAAVTPPHFAGIVNVVTKTPSGSSVIVQEDTYTFTTPPPVVPPVIILKKLIILEDAHFEYNKVTLTEDGARIVVENVKVLMENPAVNIRIAGYASAAGTKEYNQDLSERRAQAVKQILITDGGVAPERLTTIGYGETRPAEYEPIPENVNSLEAQANMRVLFEIIVK